MSIDILDVFLPNTVGDESISNKVKNNFINLSNIPLEFKTLKTNERFLKK